MKICTRTSLLLALLVPVRSRTEPEQFLAEVKAVVTDDFAAVEGALRDEADRVLEITDGMGADMFMEATGLPEVVYPGIERVIWEGRTLLSTVVVTARAEAKMLTRAEQLVVLADSTKFETRGLTLGHGVWDVVFERI